jgi:hypothetical protein
MSNTKLSAATQHNQTFWSRCPFCLAANGLFNSSSYEHTSRCRFIGPAASFDTMRPNYSKFIAEDDVRLLPLMEAAHELPKAKRKIKELEKKIFELTKSNV